MNQHTQNRPLFTDKIPAFASELQQILEEQGEPALAAQVPGLMIFDRCRCGDAVCATVYTQPRPDGAFGSGHRNVALTPKEGMIILDVVAGEIACVEVLDCPELRRQLDIVFP